ncbi:MAG: efflux RND transporter permease subunit [Deltaproteobacteria bacterium]|nr:efflux RND transporter permease subunit [Deltaproteobacteria bacterium]
MFNRLIQFSLRNRLFVVAAAALMLVYGGWAISKMPVDVLPDLNRPTVTIMTEAGGLSPEEVETLVTRPIEVAMNGAPSVQRVRSASGIGLSIAWIEFTWDTDIYRARQMVSERLQIAREGLPEGVAPVMGPIASIMGEIVLIGLVSEAGETSPMELRGLADWTVRQRLLTIPGVAQVVNIGGEVRQYQVRVHPERLLAFNVTLEEVEKAAGSSQNNTTGGFVERKSQEFLVRNIGRTQSLDDLRNTVVTYRHGAPVLLRHVATVDVGARFKRGDASIDARPGVILSVQKQPGSNTVILMGEIERALEELEAGLPKDVKVVELFKQSSFIEAAIGNVEEALRDGAILVVVILFLFLLNFRTTAITLTAIPLSIVTTAIVFRAFGLSINTMTLGGLAVAIGELVDDAIVDVENVLRRVRENRHLPAERQKPFLEVIYQASSEVRNSIVFATVLVVLVFIPLFSLSGIEGRIFAPLGVAYILSILASLVVSLTVTPALCSYLLPTAKVTEHGDGFLVRWLKKQDTRLLHSTLRHPNRVMWAAVAMVAVAAASVPFLGAEFMPPFNEGTATLNVLSAPGTSLSESNRIGTLAEQLIRQVPEVASTGRRTGRAELDEHAEGVHYSEIEVDFRPSQRSREELLDDVRHRLEQIPGVLVGIGQPISHRLDHLLSGVRAQLAVKVFGNDLDTLRAKAGEIQKAMSAVDGVVDLQIEQQVLVPQIRIRPRREAAVRYGVQVGELTETLETALNGRVVGQILDGQRTHEILVRYDESSRSDLEALRMALIDTPAGTQVPLASLAEIVEDAGPNVVMHENVQRRIVISCNVSGRDLGSVVVDIQDKVAAEVPLPTGYFVTYGGQFEAQQAASRLIAILSLFSLAGMVLVLYSHFRSMRIVLQILVNIPLALIGSVTAIWLTDRTLSVASLVGFITLTGIASRNTIMMISHYIHLVEHEHEQFGEEMIIRGSLERLVPVLMTALVAGFALIPLILAKGQPGKEILYPVAVVIFGGLTSSTLLDMAVTPAVFLRFGGPALESYLRERTSSKV